MSSSSYFLLLLLCAGVGAAGFLWRRHSAGPGSACLGVAGLGLAILLGWQVYQFTAAGKPRPVNRAYAAVAYHMGYEVLQELRGLNGSICLILPPETRSNQAELDSLFNTFARVLAPLPTLQIKEASLDAKPRQVAAGRLPIEAFERALAQVPEALAYVSFAGLPSDLNRLSLWATTNAAPLYAFDPSGGTNWLAALKQGRLRRVIVPRPEAQAEDRTQPTAGPPDELFARFFLLATPANADQVAAQIALEARR